MSENPSSETKALRLIGPQANSKGRLLCLQEDDLLVGVNGSRFCGTEKQLSAMVIRSRGTPLALTFLRDNETLFTVLSTSSRLGIWEQTDTSFKGAIPQLTPKFLINWEFFYGPDLRYDLQPITVSPLALFAPFLWLLRMHLWILCAVFFAAMIVTALASLTMAAAVYVIAGLHLWYFGDRYVRRDRQTHGLGERIVLAAPSEALAHRILLRYVPGAHFIFSTKFEPERQSEGDGQAETEGAAH